MIEPGDNPFQTRYASSFPALFIETNIFLAQTLATSCCAAGSSLYSTSRIGPSYTARRAPGRELHGSRRQGAVRRQGTHPGQRRFDAPPAAGGTQLRLPPRRESLYMFPRRDAIILGGSSRKGVGRRSRTRRRPRGYSRAIGRLPPACDDRPRACAPLITAPGRRDRGMRRQRGHQLVHNFRHFLRGAEIELADQ